MKKTTTRRGARHEQLYAYVSKTVKTTAMKKARQQGISFSAYIENTLRRLYKK